MSARKKDVPGSRWGIYVLANDVVLEWALGLFESLRVYAADLPLLVIPYDDRQSALAKRVKRRGYGYLDHPEVERMFRIGLRFYPNDDFCARGFRKLAAFSGPFERFFFLDSDVVALASLAEICAALDGRTDDVVYFDSCQDQAYRPGPLLEALVAAGRGLGFNAGLWVGRRGALDSARLDEALADLGADWREQLVPTAEQPFFNLAADRLGLSLASAADLVADACPTCWSGVGRLEFDGQHCRLRDSNMPFGAYEGQRFLFAHWAGFGLTPAMPNRELWETFRSRAQPAYRRHLAWVTTVTRLFRRLVGR